MKKVDMIGCIIIGVALGAASIYVVEVSKPEYVVEKTSEYLEGYKQKEKEVYSSCLQIMNVEKCNAVIRHYRCQNTGECNG